MKFTRFLFLISDKVQLILKTVDLLKLDDFEILSSRVVCNGFTIFQKKQKLKELAWSFSRTLRAKEAGG